MKVFVGILESACLSVCISVSSVCIIADVSCLELLLQFCCYCNESLLIHLSHAEVVQNSFQPSTLYGSSVISPTT